MDCPVCDESFKDKKLFLRHVEEHKARSVLNRTPEPAQILENTSGKQTTRMDRANFFGRERFEGMIHKKIIHIDDVDVLVHRRNFAEQVKKITAKHPFVYIPYFVKDLLNGISSADLLAKYHIANHLELKNIVQSVLRFDQDRHLRKYYNNAFTMNMKVPTWRKKYDTLQDSCKFFKREILELTFHNVLRSFILLFMTDHVETGKSRKELLHASESLKHSYELFRFIDDELKRSFAVFYETNFEQIGHDILDGLIAAKIFRHKPGTSKIIGKMSLDRLKKSIVWNLKHNNGSKTSSSLYTAMKYEYPSLQLLPGLRVWDVALSELVHKNIIKIDTRHNFRHSYMIFLNDDYQKIQQQLRIPETYNLEFYGRKISPDLFIDELKEIEKGDFDDKDDQVTRIAGLILAESVKLQAPHENIPQFDFSINITNYHFRDEQRDAMKKLNFKINSNIFHCRVMLDEVLTMDKYNELRLSLPEGEHGMVITFRDIPDSVRTKLSTDESIQVIDEEGIRILVSITPKVPARTGSVAKLHSDPISKLEKKLVKVNLLNYEDGLASVTVLPDNYGATVLSRSLEEVVLNENHPKYFEWLTSKYLEFLNVLMRLVTPEDLTRGLFETELYENMTTSYSKHIFNFRYNRTILDLNNQNRNNMFDCDCMRWAENKFYLCPHLIHSLDYVVRNSFLATWNDNGSIAKNALESIVAQGISIILDKLGLEPDLDDEHHNKMNEFISYTLQAKE